MGKEGAKLAQGLMARVFRENLPTYSSLFYSTLQQSGSERASVGRASHLLIACRVRRLWPQGESDISQAFCNTLAFIQEQLLALASQKESYLQEFGTTVNIGVIWGGNRLTVANGMLLLLVVPLGLGSYANERCSRREWCS